MTDYGAVIRFAGVGILATFSTAIIREIKRESAQGVSLGVFVLMLCFTVPFVAEIVNYTSSLGEYVGGEEGEYILLVVKALGITYLSYVSAEICKAAGEGSVASQIELFGRLEILIMCLPYFKKLISLALL